MLISLPTFLDENYKLQPRLIRIFAIFLALFWFMSSRCCITNLNKEPGIRLFWGTT